MPCLAMAGGGNVVAVVLPSGELEVGGSGSLVDWDGIKLGCPVELVEVGGAELEIEPAADPPPLAAALTPIAAAIATTITPTIAPITMNMSRPAFVCRSFRNQATRRLSQLEPGPGT